MNLNTVEELLADIRQGRMVILMDDEDRENEGDLVLAASHVSPEAINFMARHARGLICLTLTQDRCRQLSIGPMVNSNGTQLGTNFTASIEAASGVTTGISAADRAHTIKVAVAPHAKPADIVSPGHVFPLMAQPGGVLNRAGHTEAGCDLARLAGLEPAAVIVEIMNEDGTMARRPDLEKFALQHNLKIGTIADLIHYRILHEQTVTKTGEHPLSTLYGDFRMVTFRDAVDGAMHVALVNGEIVPDEVTTVRVHQMEPLRDVLGVRRDGKVGWSIQRAMQEVTRHGPGVVILLSQDFLAKEIEERMAEFLAGRNPLANRAEGTAVYRTVGTGSQILRALGVTRMRLLSSPIKFNALSGFDLEIVEYVEAKED
ncbi:MAG: bifunctional 3,4-dihydroxy-2-butanone-4-phosphate synthase/GTP cyclohydrolase II [Gammaproteobacteria bacterium]